MLVAIFLFGIKIVLNWSIYLFIFVQYTAQLFWIVKSLQYLNNSQFLIMKNNKMAIHKNVKAGSKFAICTQRWMVSWHIM